MYTLPSLKQPPHLLSSPSRGEELKEGVNLKPSHQGRGALNMIPCSELQGRCLLLNFQLSPPTRITVAAAYSAACVSDTDH